MANWTGRSTGYKLGGGLMFFSALFFLIGFGAPYWFSYETYLGVRSTFGLWMQCGGNQKNFHCATIGTGVMMSWFTAVQVLQCFALIGMGVSGLFFIYANCIQATFKTPRVLEVTTGLSGILGFISCMVFVGKMEASRKFLGWAFAFDLTGSLLHIVCALIILLTSQAGNDPAASSTGSTTGFQLMATKPGQPGQIIALPNTQSYPPPQAGYQEPPSTQSYPPPQAGYQQQPPPQGNYGAPAGQGGYSGYNYSAGYSGANPTPMGVGYSGVNPPPMESGSDLPPKESGSIPPS